MLKKNQISLIHAHSPPPSGFIAYIINKIFKIPYFYTIHGLDYPFRRLLNFDISFVAKNAVKTIVVSRVIRNFLITNYNLKNIVLFPNLIDASEYFHIQTEGEKNNLIKKVGLDSLLKKEDLIVTYIGYMILPQKVKGMIDFLNAFNNFLLKIRSIKVKSGIKLIYVGDGEYYSILEKRVNSLKINKNVFVGSPYHAEKIMLASLMSQKSKISDDAQKSFGFLTFHNNPQVNKCLILTKT